MCDDIELFRGWMKSKGIDISKQQKVILTSGFEFTLRECNMRYGYKIVVKNSLHQEEIEYYATSKTPSIWLNGEIETICNGVGYCKMFLTDEQATKEMLTRGIDI